MKLSVVTDYMNKKTVRVMFADDKSIPDMKYGIKNRMLEDVPVSGLQYFNGDVNEVAFIPGEYGIILCGTGDSSKLNAEILRNCGASVIASAISMKIDELAVVVPELKKFTHEQTLQYISEGIALSNYRFARYKTPDKKSDKPVDKIIFISSAEDAQAIIKRTGIISSNTFLCRDMINDTSDEINPVSFAKKAAELSKKTDLKCTILDKKEITKKKMGFFLQSTEEAQSNRAW